MRDRQVAGLDSTNDRSWPEAVLPLLLSIWTSLNGQFTVLDSDEVFVGEGDRTALCILLQINLSHEDLVPGTDGLTQAGKLEIADPIVICSEKMLLYIGEHAMFPDQS